MTIRGDVQAMIESSAGDYDKATEGIFSWLTSADVLSRLNREFDEETVMAYADCVSHLREVCI